MAYSPASPASSTKSYEPEKILHRADVLTAPQTPQTPRTPRPSDQKTLHCPYDDCPKTFNRQARLTEHLRSHTNERIFHCPENGCSKNFLRESHLKAHVKSAHSGVRDYNCTWNGCEKGFATGTRLRRHEKTHEEKEKYRCRGYSDCDAVFRKHATLNRHILSIHQGIKPFSCQHLDEHTGEQCEMAFDTAEKLRSHQRAKHDDTRYTCADCLENVMQNEGSDEMDQFDNTPDYSFPSYSLLQSHITIAHPPACPHCHHIASTRRELKRHIELTHDSETLDKFESQQLFPCTSPSCDRIFTKRGNLTVHTRTVHEGRKEFTCGATDLSSSSGVPWEFANTYEACGRSFTSKSSLEEHVRTSHLGMQSRRAERKSKRKLAAGVDDPTVQENGKERKRKTVNRTRPEQSVFSQLTGISDQEVASFELPGYTEAETWQDDEYGGGLENVLGQYPQVKTEMGFDGTEAQLSMFGGQSLGSLAIDPHLLRA